MRTILEYMGARHASQLVDGAKDAEDAIKKVGEFPKTFKPPVVSATLPRNVQQHTNQRVDGRLEQWQSWWVEAN